MARSSKRSSERVRTRAGKPAPRAPHRSVPDKPAAKSRPKSRPKPQSPAATSPASAAPASTPEELAKAKLASLTDKVRRVIADAQALAASGTQQGFSLAANMLQHTLRPLLASIDGVLAPFGLSATSSATAGNPAFADLLGPLRGLLDSVQLLLQRLPSGG